MPSDIEIFNRILDQNTLRRLKVEDAAALRMFQILNRTREELYRSLRAFEETVGTGSEARYTAVMLSQLINEVNITFARMEQEVSPEFRAQLQAGYTEAQRQTFAEIAVFEAATPGFPETFRPVPPTDAVLQFLDGQSQVMRDLNAGLRNRMVQEIQRLQPNISDAEALQAAGASAERLKEALARGILSGDGTQSIARRLAAPVDGEFVRLANNTIMRTVRLGINEAFNQGHEETIRESAKVVPGLGKCWLSALRRSTRICLDLHGQKCEIEESFRTQGTNIARPPAIGPTLTPKFHVCRSRVVPWNSKWPPNPKLDELSTDEKLHFLSSKEKIDGQKGKGGDWTPKQRGPGPLASQGSKEALKERSRQLKERLDLVKKKPKV